MTKSDRRTGGSTGTRISTGRFSPSSPKGGFGDPVYQTAKNIGQYFGYDPEGYYKQRLFGSSRADKQWRYDLAHHLLGRPTWKNRVWLQEIFPTFGKKKWPETLRKDLQKGNQRGTSKLHSRFPERLIRGRNRRNCYWSNYSHRWECSNR